MPKVSIIIPTRNRKNLLVEAIESVRAQTLRDFEILVVDNGSTDGTQQAVAQIGDERIRCFRELKRGISPARNAAIRKSRGIYLSLLDDDDLYPPDYLQVMTEQLDQQTQYGLAYAQFQDNFPDGRKKMGFQPDRFKSGWRTRDFFGRMPIILPSAVVMRRSAIEGLWFDEAIPYNEDVDFLMRLSLRCPFLCVSQAVVTRRIFSDNLTLYVDKMGKSLTPWIMERFYRYYYQDKDVVSIFRARKKIASEFSGLAKLHLHKKCRKAAMSLYAKAVYYYPWRPRYYKKYIRAFFLDKKEDPMPDWTMPAPMPKEILVRESQEK